ncbi:tetratricopeptide repeat protein [Tenacibaculum tangerinum]|uniref:Tetratricopeptide repeat protein n=1 Tax=Tenacibaculum tangerinum TaxID=3038772 RepID=A0ABY8KYJ3_9FLAO|nr:tetratricopeptide repeat protein [Tenacibaculum tangerinum]WGH74307.1 tetratricopeptide repeat protein [Tenacibaculum tangerinum]
MKNLCLLFFAFYIVVNPLSAQSTCEKNLTIAKKYLEKRHNIREALLEEIKTSLDSCPANNGKYFYVKGLIELRKKSTPNYDSAFEHFKTSAEYGFTRAKTYLGYFYKNGWSRPIDYNQSLYWIQQAANEEDNNALYTLGYYYLKGLANLEPDYDKAVSYFEQSNHKMAKHWLAFCQYFGFGIAKDEVNAENSLETIDTPNSKALLAYLNNLQHDTVDFEMFTSPEQAISTNLLHTNESENLYGLWLEKDWKNKKTIRKLPIIIETGSNNDTKFNIKIEEQTYSIVVDDKGKLVSKDVLISLPSPFSLPNKPELNTYRITCIDMTKDTREGIYDIECVTWIEEYKEDGPPITIRVYSDEALAKKIDKTFTVYPTIFREKLNFSVTTEHQSNIRLSLFDVSGNMVKTKNYGECKSGKLTFEFLTNDVPMRNYIAVLHVNNLRFARHVIKVN